MKDILALIFVIAFVGGVIWLMFQPDQSYLGTYCNPQNVCRYEHFNYQCPPTDEGNIVIGSTDKLKPGSCVNE